MPLYEFHCLKCGRDFEETQTVDEHERKTPRCPQCGSTKRIERQLSTFTAVTSRKA